MSDKKKGMNEEVLRALFSKQLRESKDKETGEPDGKWPLTGGKSEIAF